MDQPAWLLGSHADPSFTYGVFIGSRELAAELYKLDGDIALIGMLRPQNEHGVKEDLH